MRKILGRKSRVLRRVKHHRDVKNVFTDVFGKNERWANVEKVHRYILLRSMAGGRKQEDGP